MFSLLLLVLLGLATFHAARLREGGREAVAEVYLRYVLVGYCGIPILAVSIASLAWPEATAAYFGFEGGTPLQGMLSWAHLGMSVTAILALRFRGPCLLGPAIAWAVFWFGATTVHLGAAGGHAAASHGQLLMILFNHGFVSVILVAALIAGRRTFVGPAGTR